MLIRILGMAAIFHGACACAASQLAPGTFLIEGEASAIDAARRGFLADYRAQLTAEIAATKLPKAQESMRAEVALLDAGAALGPSEIVAKSSRLDIAGRQLQLNLETHAVTAGDVWVFDPETPAARGRPGHLAGAVLRKRVCCTLARIVGSPGGAAVSTTICGTPVNECASSAPPLRTGN